MNQSLDGYVNHDAFGPGPVLFQHFIEQVRGLAGSVYGRRIYEIMRYWDDDRPEWDAPERAFAEAWRAQPKWVVSRTLTSVGPNATLISTDVEDTIRDLKARMTGELDLAGTVLAQSLSATGLIDAYRLYMHPVVLGGGTPFFAGPRPPLRLAASEMMDEQVIRLTYIPASGTAAISPQAGGSVTTAEEVTDDANTPRSRTLIWPLVRGALVGATIACGAVALLLGVFLATSKSEAAPFVPIVVIGTILPGLLLLGGLLGAYVARLASPNDTPRPDPAAGGEQAVGYHPLAWTAGILAGLLSGAGLVPLTLYGSIVLHLYVQALLKNPQSWIASMLLLVDLVAMIAVGQVVRNVVDAALRRRARDGAAIDPR
jgi:dihydrofolate reductase